MIYTDSSTYGLETVLLQEREVTQDTGGGRTTLQKAWVTIGYWYVTLIAAEWNCNKIDRECLSVVWALKTLTPCV